MLLQSILSFPYRIHTSLIGTQRVPEKCLNQSLPGPTFYFMHVPQQAVLLKAQDLEDKILISSKATCPQTTRIPSAPVSCLKLQSIPKIFFHHLTTLSRCKFCVVTLDFSLPLGSPSWQTIFVSHTQVQGHFNDLPLDVVHLARAPPR